MKLGWALALFACGKSSHGSDLAATAQIEGTQVVVAVTCKTAQSVHYQALPAVACKDKARIEFPVAQLGSAGVHDLVIEGAGDNVAHAQLAVPADVLTAKLEIAGCAGSGSNVQIFVPGAASPTTCSLEPTLATKLKLTAPAGVDVTIGKKGYIAPPSGPLDVELDLADVVLDKSSTELRDAASLLDLPWHVGASSGKFSVSIAHSGPPLAQWLSNLAVGAIARPAFAPKAGTLAAFEGSGIDSTLPDRPLRDHKLLAIAIRGGEKPIGACKKRSLVGYDATVDVYDLASWQKIATRVFPADKKCPADSGTGPISAEPRRADIMTWLSSDVTKQAGPAPTSHRPRKGTGR